MDKPAGYLKINLETFLRPNVKKGLKEIVFPKHISWEEKKRILVWLEILKASIFAKFNCTKKIPVYKINVRNEKNPITQLNYSNGFYYLITVVQ